MKSFWTDPSRDFTRTYPDLIRDLNGKRVFKKYIHYRDPYQILRELIFSLALGLECHLLDSDFSPEEISHLGINPDQLRQASDTQPPAIPDYPALIRQIESQKQNTRIVIYTSGTTGRPKSVSYRFEVLQRAVKKGEKFKNDVWAFAYNPTHFAGIQVFLQAFLNQNPMVNIFDLSGQDLARAISGYNVTNISATPTFYRKMLAEIDGEFPAVKRITLGGEKFDPTIERQLAGLFPNAVIRNIYASTEAGTLFTATNDVFSIDPDIKPFIQFEPDGELLIHKDLLGDFNSMDRQGDWYYTGDMVEFIDPDHFKFISRKSEMINVGGYKVNPHEVEEEIRKVNGVLDARVKARANRITGYILMAEISRKNGLVEAGLEKRIMDHLKNSLQEFKIPRLFKFVEKLELTRTGKKERQ
jgi:acyl-coenzyme A synthetase/AMP-(fatty) acid ligase